jgi:hypothetical protein
MEGTFEVDVRSMGCVVNVGRNSPFERWYLINAVLEDCCLQKDWKVLVQQIWDRFEVVVECQKINKHALSSGTTRLEAFLEAYLEMLTEEKKHEF